MSRRFYNNVQVKSCNGGYQVLLDQRVLKTPNGKPLICPDRAQAACVADEWRAQGENIDPQSMPCTRLMNVAIAQTPDRRPDLIKEFVKYAGTDLLCYRVAHPEELARRQEESWQKWLDWAEDQHGIALVTTKGIHAIAQPERSLEQAKAVAKAFDNVRLTLLLHFTASFGSAILALAVIEQALDVQTGFALSRLDEIYQNEHWGVDMEAIDKAGAQLAELQKLAKLIED